MQEAESQADKAEKKQKKAQQQMGKTTQNSLGGMAKMALGAAAAYGVVNKALRETINLLRDVEAERKRGAERITSDLDQTKRLAQVADVKGPDTLASLIRRSEQLAAQTGIEPSAAKGIIFQGKSVQALAETENLARRISPFVPSAAAPGILEAAFTIKQNLPQLSMQEIVNVMGRGAQRTKLSLAQFGEPIAEAAPIAKLVQGAKFNIEEITATAGAIVGPTTSPEKAMTQLNRFLVGAGRAGLGGMDIPELLEKVATLQPVSDIEKAELQKLAQGRRGPARIEAERRLAEGKQYAEIFGRVEAQKFFASAGSPEQIERIRRLEQELILARKATGTAASFIAERQRVATGTPTLAAGLRGLRAEQRLGVAEARAFGVEDIGRQAITKEMAAESIEAGASRFGRQVGKRFAGGAEFIGMSEEQIGKAFAAGQRTGERLRINSMAQAAKAFFGGVLRATGVAGQEIGREMFRPNAVQELAGPAGFFNAAPGDIGFGGAMGAAGIEGLGGLAGRQRLRMAQSRFGASPAFGLRPQAIGLRPPVEGHGLPASHVFNLRKTGKPFVAPESPEPQEPDGMTLADFARQVTNTPGKSDEFAMRALSFALQGSGEASDDVREMHRDFMNRSGQSRLRGN
jgi:hypothetical protein